MNRRTTLLFALTCAVAVGNLYFPQAIVPLIATGLGTTADSAALTVTATQAGYTAGMFLLVPLGDRLRHRSLLVALLTLAGLSLLAAGCAPDLPFLVAASAVTGFTTVAAPLISPLAATLTDEGRRGAVLGTLASGSIGGMLLVRTFSGSLGEWWGWRVPYVVAAFATLLLAVALSRVVPVLPPPSRSRYPALLAEPLRLLRTEPELRRSCLYQATVFAGFSAVWTCLAFQLTGPAYGMGAQAVGLLALVGSATMLCAPLAGRLVDRQGPGPVNTVCLLAVLVSAGILVAGGLGGAHGFAALIAGTLLLDVAMQCGMIANTTRVYALRPDARSRLNTAFMTCAYLGGTAGSWLGARTYGVAGWWGVPALVAALTLVALGRHAVAPRGMPSSVRRDAPGGPRCAPGSSVPQR
ncbi:MFS transporter [Streptomyces triticagri]|uniref:MFS transporter n=1 Tax=Streptomyces triticagri TaxID=2293568 RepID=A0A372M0W0_9ACTN|nr:MFS transporter [Streptomyces triticagri]RFU84153.1 MFS transporter [Streptomyces triticagri]